MEIIFNIDVMMAKRKISAGDLAERIGITPANLSILKNGKAKAIRFSTLIALCRELNCQPGDILEYREYREQESHVRCAERREPDNVSEGSCEALCPEKVFVRAWSEKRAG